MTHAKFDAYLLALHAAQHACGIYPGSTPRVIKFPDGYYGAEVVLESEVHPVTFFETTHYGAEAGDTLG